MKPCDLSRECRVIRVVMLVSFVPICLLFYAATYSARVTLASWRCVPRQLTSKTSHAIRKSEAEAEEHRPLANEKIHFHNDDHNVSNRTTKTVRRLANGDAVPTATGGYCDTIFDQSRGNVLSFLGKRNTIMIVRSVSLANTFLTYCSAWIATYNLHFLPLLWLAVVSFSSFFVTLEVSILTGPLSFVNNFEVVPVTFGLGDAPFIISGMAVLLDLTIAILALLLVLDIYQYRSKKRGAMG